MHFFKPQFKQVLLFCIFVILSTSVFAQSADFKIQHIEVDVPGSGLTLASTSLLFDGVSDLSKSFIIISNNRRNGAGPIGSGGTVEARGLSCTVYFADSSTIIFSRGAGATITTRVNIMVVEYIGPAGGPNEIVVRHRGSISPTNGTSPQTLTMSSTPTNINRCIPFYSVQTTDTTNGAAADTFMAYCSGTNTLNYHRGGATNTVTASIEVIEFIGSNWSVGHGDSGNTGNDIGTVTLRQNADGTGTTFNVGNWSNAFIWHTYKGDSNSGSNEAIADNYPVYIPNGTTQVNWQFHPDHDGVSERHFVHVLVNSNMNVTRFSDTASGADESTINISSAGLTFKNQSLILGSSYSSGGGTAYGRGWRNYYINTITEAAHWAHRSGNTMLHEIQIIDLVGLRSMPEINIQGNATNILDGDITPTTADHTDFGTVTTIGASIVRTFTIQNSGLGVLNLSGTPRVAISGTNAADFTVTTMPSATVAGSGGSTTFQITFNPSAAGVKNATVTIVNNDADENPYDFSITGALSCPVSVFTGGTAIQSSTYPGGDASKAFDGNTNGLWANSSVSHTNYDNNPWWELDMGVDNTIDNVVIYNRTDCCGNRLDNFILEVLDASNNIVYTHTNGAAAVTNTVSGISTLGRKIRIRLIGNQYLQLAEVVVNVSNCSLPEINIQGNATNILDGDITPTTADHTDFGNVNTAGGTLIRTFTIQNSGLGVLNLSGTPRVAISGANASDFTVTTLPNATVAGSGGSTTFQITFDPSADGVRTATVTIANNDANENPYDFSIRGTGVTSCINPAPPTLVLPSAATVICNGNSLNLNATSAGNTIYWYTQAAGGSSIGNSVSGTNFSVSPTSNTTYYAEARTNTGGCISASRTATALITVNNPPTATINYSGAPFCKSVSTAQTVSLTGTGTFTGGTYSASPAGLTINSSTGAITPSSSTAGTYTVTYTIAAAGGCSAVTATRLITITAVPIATFSYSGSPYCSNGINPSPTYSGGGVAGTFSSTAGLNFVSTSTGQINVSSSTPGTYTVTNTIAASGGCGVVTATSSITINATPTITSTTPGSNNGPGTVNLSATASVGSTISWYAASTGGTALGTGPSFTTPGIIATTTYYVEASNGPCTPSTRVAVVATIHYAEITVLGNGNIIIDEDTSPVTTDYTNLGSTGIGVGLTRTYTIQNTGTINLTIGAITIGGVHSSDFLVTTAPAASVAPGGSTTFSLTFTPTVLGVRNANISFVTNDPDENPFNFDIAGTGSTGLIPEINVQGLGNNIIDGSAGTSAVNGTYFGSVGIPGTVVRTFTIQNTGTGPLLLTGIPLVVITGSSNFTVTSQPSSSTIAASTSLTFQITFNPTVTGSSIAIVSINNNDSNEAIYDFAIAGDAVVSGREIDIQGNETSIVDGDTTPDIVDQTDFGVTDTTTPISIVYTVHSFGSSSLTINSTVSITGANNSMFTATPVSATSLAAGGVANFVVTFTPTASLGVKTATISVFSNDADEGTYNFDIKAEVKSIPAQTVAPGGVTSNLKFWLKADSNIGSLSDNSTIYTWVDQTFGSTKNALSKFSKEPKFQNNSSYNVNFNPVIHFNGNNYMSGGQGFNNSDMFIVVKPTNPVTYTTSPMDIYCGDDKTTNRGSQDVTGFEMGNTSARHDNELLAYNQGAETSYGVSEISTTKIYAGVNIFNPRKHATFPTTKMEILNNGNTLSTSTVNNGSYLDIVNSRYWLGRSEYWDASYDGDILEVINYSGRNNDTDKRKIETYLAIKYGITLGINGTSVDYLNSSGTVIYNAGATFNYNIAGIGRDDKAQLNQKQSKTENSVNDITVGLNDIFDVNSNNPNSFANDKDYLVWGHNNNTLNAQTPITVNLSAGISGLSTPVEFTPIGRAWRVIETGGNVPTVKVSIPSIMLTATLNPPGDFLMFISNSPVFNPSAEYRIMTMNGSKLEANYDFNGTKYITFGYAPEKTYSRSIYFNGTTDYLDAGNKFNLNSSFTISAWIKKSTNNKSILSKRNSAFANGGYDFKINSTGRLEMTWKNGTTQTITSSIVIPNNVWHHVAVVYNGTIGKLFIDGVEDSTQTKSMSTPISNNESFIIAAADGLATSSFFQGNIDEVRIWNTALTESQLRYIMNQEIQRNGTAVSGSYFQNFGITPTKNDINPVPWANLAGYYPMSTYTYTNCKDASGNGNTAAIQNLVTVDYQTAPLPYVSAANTNWNLNTTWSNGSSQTIPGEASLIAPTVDRDGDLDIDNDDRLTIDWNIVQISSNVLLDNPSLPGANLKNRNVLGLFIDATKQLEVTGTNPTAMSAASGTGNGITVSHYLELKGKIDLQGESQLIQTENSDLAVGTNGVLERDQQGEGNLFRYNDWSSPVYTAIDGTGKYTTIATALKDGTNPSSPGPIVFSNSGYDGKTSPLTLSTYWMYIYRNDLTNNYSKWFQVRSTGNIYSGEGFLMKGTGAPNSPDQNYVFIGKPNNGDINLTVAGTNDYLIGNPYPSAIDADQFIDDNANSINGALYFWEHYGGDSHVLAQYQAGYSTLTKAGATPASAHPATNTASINIAPKLPTRYIPIGQGFFVQGDTDGGIISFKNRQRIYVTETSGNSVFMKGGKNRSTSTTNLTDTRQKIRIGFDAKKIDHRQLLLTFDEKTTDNVDWGYEAELYEEFEDDMYWVIESKKYVIQATNTAKTLAKEMPLGIKLKEKGTIKIKIDELENEDKNLNIYLKDSLLGIAYDLKLVNFEKELEPGEYKNRFYIVFKPLPQKIIVDNSASDNELDRFVVVDVIANDEEYSFNIKKKEDVKIYGAKLYNYLGQNVKTWNKNLNEEINTISLKIATGVYIIQIETSKGIVNKKILIK